MALHNVSQQEGSAETSVGFALQHKTRIVLRLPEEKELKHSEALALLNGVQPGKRESLMETFKTRIISSAQMHCSQKHGFTERATFSSGRRCLVMVQNQPEMK